MKKGKWVAALLAVLWIVVAIGGVLSGAMLCGCDEESTKKQTYHRRTVVLFTPPKADRETILAQQALAMELAALELFPLDDNDAQENEAFVVLTQCFYGRYIDEFDKKFDAVLERYKDRCHFQVKEGD